MAPGGVVARPGRHGQPVATQPSPGPSIDGARQSKGGRIEMSGVKVVVAEDSAVLRDALADLIRDEPRLELVGVAFDAEEAVVMAGVLRPEVAVLDVKMPGGGGQHAASGITRVSPDTRILAFSTHDDRRTLAKMLAPRAPPYLVT